MARAGRAAALGFAAFVGGCSLFGKGPQPPCPSLAVVEDAGRLVDFRPGPGRDLTDVRLEAEIADVSQTCEYDADGFVDTNIVVDFVAARGPAADSAIGRLSYFVALTDPAGAILAKEVFPVEAELGDIGIRRRLRDEVTQHIVFAPARDARDFKSFIGFQLTPEQLDDNRHQRHPG